MKPAAEKHLPGITVGYIGTHQIYQLALAAHEIGRLDRFYCSLIDAPGKWGRLAARVFGAPALTSRRCPQLPARLVSEYPWPWLSHRLLRRGPDDWSATNETFDRHVAGELRRSRSRVFVGTETCAEHCFREARQLGMSTVMDCPQVHPRFLEEVLARAADDLGLLLRPVVDTPAMQARKQHEFSLADTFLLPSEVSRRSFLAHGFADAQLKVIPLWADQTLWHTPPGPGRPAIPGRRPLQALFVGRMDLRKGVPYLLQAIRECRGAVELSMIGAIDPEMQPFLHGNQEYVRCLSPMTKPELRQKYRDADLLVMPSLVDSFGFVAMEAMACGIPVIVSESSGVPVPDPSWRVPIMDAAAVARRLLLYENDRDLCRGHGELAAAFVRSYQPETYRRKVSEILKTSLDR